MDRKPTYKLAALQPLERGKYNTHVAQNGYQLRRGMHHYVTKKQSKQMLATNTREPTALEETTDPAESRYRCSATRTMEKMRPTRDKLANVVVKKPAKKGKRAVENTTTSAKHCNEPSP